MPSPLLHGVQRITVDAERVGQRIDNFLFKHLKRVPKSHVYRLIRKGEIRVNGKRIKAHYHLNVGDMVRIAPIRLLVEDKPITLDNKMQAVLERAILYEDEDLLVLNKPEGMAVHGGSTINVGLIDALRALRPDAKNLELAHRLDKPTSGCLILTKKMSVLRLIHEQIREHKIKKHYHALVAGNWPKALNKINVPLKKNTLSSGERIVRVDKMGKESLTTFEIIEQYNEATLIGAHLKTGRTHQIRVHCQYAKHPIIGDHKYMSRETLKHFNQTFNIKRLCLHAYRIEFIHPKTQKTLAICAPYPPSFVNALKNIIK